MSDQEVVDLARGFQDPTRAAGNIVNFAEEVGAYVSFLSFFLSSTPSFQVRPLANEGRIILTSLPLPFPVASGLNTQQGRQSYLSCDPTARMGEDGRSRFERYEEGI